MRKPKHDVLGALTHFGAEAVALLRGRFGTPSMGPTWYWDWERTSEEYFAAVERIGWNTTEWYEIWDEAQELGSYEVAVEAIESDERTKGQLGQLVGTSQSRSLLEPRRLFLSDLVYPAVNDAESYELDSNDLIPYAERLVETLATDLIEARQLVQVLGIVGGEAQIVLSDGVLFRRMTDEELGAQLRFQVIVSPSSEFDALGPANRRVPVASQYGLIAARRHPKVIGDAAMAPVSSIDLGEIADSFVSAARLVTRRKIARGRAVELTGDWKSERWLSANFGPAQIPPIVDKVELSDAQLESIATLSGELRQPDVQRLLGIALRRFQEVPLRANEHDKLIDLMVAAEALFLPGDKVELTYKLSTRAAIFVGVDGVTPSEVFRFMKKAYDARSRLIHGEELPTLQRLDGSPGSLTDVLEDLETVLTDALMRAVDAVVDRGSMPDWDDELASLLDRPADD